MRWTLNTIVHRGEFRQDCLFLNLTAITVLSALQPQYPLRLSITLTNASPAK